MPSGAARQLCQHSLLPLTAPCILTAVQLTSQGLIYTVEGPGGKQQVLHELIWDWPLIIVVLPIRIVVGLLHLMLLQKHMRSSVMTALGRQDGLLR